MTVTWDYVAGFFDGEGTLGIYRYGSRTKTQVAMYNTSKQVLEEIQAFLGYGWLRANQRENPRWKDGWVLTISKQGLQRKFLSSVVGKLIVKKQTAEEMLAFIEAPRRRKRMDCFDADTIAKKYSELMSLRKTASYFGTNRGTIARILKCRTP